MTCIIFWSSQKIITSPSLQVFQTRVLIILQKPSLYNETQIGQYTAQEDLHIAADEEREMLCIVSNCWHILKINNSQVMMVGIAFAMPFEIQQFELLHVCMHIDVTPDSNK
jgi:predicted cupin superfamily sugar epimerase